MKKILLLILFFTKVLFINRSNAQKKLPYGLQIFKNMEQIEYCIPLPLKDFKETYDTERAQHTFIHKKNKKVTIQLSGFYSDDKNITLENYYTKSYTEEEEMSGKIITQKELLKNKQCFYAIGYFNNFMDQYEFIEITWVRKDEVIKMEVMYSLKEKALWKNRLKVIVKKNYCN